MSTPDTPRGTIEDLQRSSFTENSEGKVARRVVGEVAILVGDLPEGSLPVFISEPGEVVNEFSEISAVATSVESTIQTYTVPALQTFLAKQIEVGGDNIALYSILINGLTEARVRTNFGTHLNHTFNLDGLTLQSGDIIEVKVIHERPMVGAFESRILGTLRD